MKTFTDAQRRAVALGWASSGLDQATYAARHGISARTLRSWIARHASRQLPVDQVRVIVRDMVGLVEKLQDVLDRLDAPAGMPGGSDLPEVDEPNQPTTIVSPPAGTACPAAPPPAPLPTQRPRPVPAPSAPMAGVKINRNSYFYGM